jgi:hypothetical protein
MESAKQQYLNLKEGKMTQAQFMRNIRMSLPQYVTNVSSFEDTVKILKNKGILTEADIKTEMFEQGMSLEDAKAEAQKESEEDGVSVHINSVGKGRYQVSYWYDSDSTVASYEDGILTNEYDEYSDEDNDEYFFDVNAEELDETDIYGIAGNPEEEEIAKSARIPNKNISNEDKFDIIKRDGSKIQGVQFFKNGEWYKDTEKGGRHLGGKVPEGSKVVKSSMNELDETDIYGIAGNPEEEEISRSARIPRRKMPDELDAILKGLDDEEDAKHVMGDKSDFKLKESKIPTGKSLYDRFSEIDRLNGQEVLIGLDYEMEDDHTLTKVDAAKIVIKNLKKIPNYYTNYDMSGVKGYQPEYLGGKSADPEAHQMKFVDKNNMIDKARGMKPVKGVEKAKASANKANKETNKAEDITLMSLIASTLRGVPKMQSQGEKVKIIRIKETLTKLVKEVMMETPDLHSIASEIFKDIKDNDSDAEDRTNIIKSYNLTPEQTDVVKEKVSHMLHNYIQR